MAAPPSALSRLKKREKAARKPRRVRPDITPERVLSGIFGHSSFRRPQKQVVEAVLRGEDALVLAPTGGGKSLCYQLPATLLRGVTIVVSPLIALMQDQVAALRAKRVPAELLMSSLPASEVKRVMADLTGKKPRTKLLYVTPETLTSRGARDWLMQLYKRAYIALLAVDEAHCISSWGHDFRPSFRRLLQLRELLPGVPCIALTATATPAVVADMKERLGMGDASVYARSFNRANLHYAVAYRDQLDDDVAHLLGWIESKGAGCGIVYTHTQADTTRLAGRLRAAGLSAAAYHAGMRMADRKAAQEAWTAGEVDIMCATIAFGMGIDVAAVRFVVHWTLPKSLEGYYQESGRAGRDGKQSHCLLYYSKDDVAKFRYFLSKEENRRAAQRGSAALEAVVRYCEGMQCRRRALLAYFGEAIDGRICKRTCDYCADSSGVTLRIMAVMSTTSTSILRSAGLRGMRNPLAASRRRGMRRRAGDDDEDDDEARRQRRLRTASRRQPAHLRMRSDADGGGSDDGDDDGDGSDDERKAAMVYIPPDATQEDMFALMAAAESASRGEGCSSEEARAAVAKRKADALASKRRKAARAAEDDSNSHIALLSPHATSALPGLLRKTRRRCVAKLAAELQLHGGEDCVAAAAAMELECLRSATSKAAYQRSIVARMMRLRRSDDGCPADDDKRTNVRLRAEGGDGGDCTAGDELEADRPTKRRKLV
eukprot:PLAT13719.1.p1 GENE.PLAT13719.1~~PLAT13719.1.p1  ORF type:complete len:723 (+),score=221.91 PLAT13719.1:26-2170(+)